MFHDLLDKFNELKKREVRRKKDAHKSYSTDLIARYKELLLYSECRDLTNDEELEMMHITKWLRERYEELLLMYNMGHKSDGIHSSIVEELKEIKGLWHFEEKRHSKR